MFMPDLKDAVRIAIELPTAPKADEADLAARREWQRTGFVPMSYVQGLLRQGFSSGQTIADLVLVSIGQVMGDVHGMRQRDK